MSLCVRVGFGVWIERRWLAAVTLFWISHSGFSLDRDLYTNNVVSNVADFQLPDPAGRAGGACTSALLDVLYKDHQNSATDMSFVQVLEEMRQVLKGKGFDQIPQVRIYPRRNDALHYSVTHLLVDCLSY